MPGFTVELTSKVAPSRLFRFAALDSFDLLPKIMPEAVASTALVHGDGGVGTVGHIKFTDAVPYDCLKERVELLDMENLEYTHSWVEGGLLGPKLHSAAYNVKVGPSGDGGSAVKITTELHPKPGVELTEEDLKADKEQFVQTFQAVEGYLLANPDTCA